MWEWFLPSGERSKYYPAIMEGPHGGGGPLEPQVVGWMWGFCFGAVFCAIALFAAYWFLGR